MRDTSGSMFNVNTSPISDQVSAKIYKENYFKIDFEKASYIKYLIKYELP